MLNPQAVHLKIGSHLGKYRILEELGEGPISHVFLADDTILYRQVVLKILKPEFAREPAGEAPEEEMNSAAVLLHSGIVPLYGTGSGSGHHYFSMALMPGGNLRQAMERGIEPHQAITIISQVARALAFAHAKGINHQSIKPENILFRKDGSAVLSDFHVVKVHGFGIGVLALEPEPHPHYISPEQIQNSGKQFGRADLYSLGIVLYEMLTGEVPFQGDKAPWQHIHSHVPTLPQELVQYQGLINRLLAKKPADRFADVNQLIKALEPFGGIKAADRSANVTVFPIGGKTREFKGGRGDRPFIEGREKFASPANLRGLDQIEAKGEMPEEELVFSSPLIPSAGLDLPLTSRAVQAAVAPIPQPAQHPSRKDAVDRGFIGDLIKERPRTPSAPAPPRPRKAPPKKVLGPTRRTWLFAAALLVVLSGSGLYWWKGNLLPSTGRPASETPSSPSSTGAEGSPGSRPSVEEALTAQFSQALEFSRSGRPADAAAIFQSIMQQYPHIPEPYNNLAVLAAADGDLEGSQRLLEEALRTNPSYAAILENLNTIQLEKALGGEIRGEKSAPRLQMIQEISGAVPHPFQAALHPSPAPAKMAQPAPGQPAATAAETANVSREITSFLSEWSKAWTTKDFPRYTAFYGSGFKPSGNESRSAWEKARHRNISAPAWIEVSLSEIHITPTGNDRMRVVAVQDYRSDRYRDRTLKAFELVREGNGWSILIEDNLGKLR